MLFVMIFLLLYMLPVIPVARRVEYIRTRPVLDRSHPERKASKIEYGYTYINGTIIKPGAVCQNCGGDEGYHAHGIHSNLNSARHGGYYIVCDNYQLWDKKKNVWPAQGYYKNTNSKIPTSIAISLAWPALVAFEGTRGAYRMAGIDWNNFAVEYKGIETRDEKIKRLEKEKAALRKELDDDIAAKELALGIKTSEYDLTKELT